NVEALFAQQLQGLVTVGRLNYVKAGLHAQQCRQRTAHHGLIFGQQYLHWLFICARGRAMVKRLWPSVSIRKSPLKALSRSRIPLKPLPIWIRAFLPLSLTLM